jgi:hypothetical protein
MKTPRTDEAFSIYEALWRRAENEGAVVRYEGISPYGEAGWFHPTYYPRPTIVLIRPYYKEPDDEPSRESTAPAPLPQPDIYAEVTTLAHEYGHFVSWSGRTERAEYELYVAAARYRDAIIDEEIKKMPVGLSRQESNERLRTTLHDRLDGDARDRILREEMLAWRIGREVLAELALADFELYDRRTNVGIHNHRYRLGIEDLWPDDIPEELSTE